MGHRHLSRIRSPDLRHLYEGPADMRENAGVSGDHRGDYQELVDEISALLGAPATLENRDFGLIAFGAYDSEGDLDASALDPVRTRSILTRRSTTAVRTWFEGFGITRATGPVRIPPTPEAGVYRGRICLPVRHRGVVLGYVWLLDDDPGPGRRPAGGGHAGDVAHRRPARGRGAGGRRPDPGAAGGADRRARLAAGHGRGRAADGARGARRGPAHGGVRRARGRRPTRTTPPRRAPCPARPRCAPSRGVPPGRVWRCWSGCVRRRS